jgi:hypothetical protein
MFETPIQCIVPEEDFKPTADLATPWFSQPPPPKRKNRIARRRTKSRPDINPSLEALP